MSIFGTEGFQLILVTVWVGIILYNGLLASAFFYSGNAQKSIPPLDRVKISVSLRLSQAEEEECYVVAILCEYGCMERFILTQ